jgi:hypothetical protein
MFGEAAAGGAAAAAVRRGGTRHNMDTRFIAAAPGTPKGLPSTCVRPSRVQNRGGGGTVECTDRWERKPNAMLAAAAAHQPGPWQRRSAAAQ